MKRRRKGRKKAVSKVDVVRKNLRKNFSVSFSGQATDKLAAAVDMSRPTLEKARAVVDAAEKRQQAGEVKKMTFYLPFELSAQLEQMRLEFKSRYRREKKVSKSEIVRIALEMSLGEWLKNPKSFPEEALPLKVIK